MSADTQVILAKFVLYNKPVCAGLQVKPEFEGEQVPKNGVNPVVEEVKSFEYIVEANIVGTLYKNNKTINTMKAVEKILFIV